MCCSITRPSDVKVSSHATAVAGETLDLVAVTSGACLDARWLPWPTSAARLMVDLGVS